MIGGRLRQGLHTLPARSRYQGLLARLSHPKHGFYSVTYDRFTHSTKMSVTNSMKTFPISYLQKLKNVLKAGSNRALPLQRLHSFMSLS